MSSSLTQCWFCSGLNIIDHANPAPCRHCSVLPKEARPNTSPVVMSQMETAALTAQVAAAAPTASVTDDIAALQDVDSGASGDTDGFTVVMQTEATATARSGVANVAAPQAATQWVIETEDGDIVPLTAGDVIVGRRPVATDGAAAVPLPDATRTLSKSHARLRHDATRDIWTVEDLASTNGVAVLTSDGEVELSPHVVTPVQEYVAFGMLRCRVILVSP